MESKSAERSHAAEKPPARGFLWFARLVKVLAAIVGVVLSGVVLMSLLGLFTDNVWVQAGGAGLVMVVVPLVLADRLLPKDGATRPGLVTDVVAVTWMGGASAAVVLGTSLLQGPLETQAARFDEQGWSEVAWGTRWAAGTQTPGAEGVEVEREDEAVALAGTAEVEEVVVEPSEEVAEVVAEMAEPSAIVTPPAKAEDEADDDEVLNPAELFAAWAPSVVTINVETGFGTGAGTGFVIDDRGTIVTNHHVIAQADKITIKLFDGSKSDSVELLDSNPDDDLALLRMKIDELPPPVALGVSADVVVGESVVVIGNPIGLEHTMTDGLVSSRRLYEGKKYIQMSAPVSPGNSGGPVFDERGDVIGITVAKLWGENLNLAIPIDMLKPMIKSEYPDARGFEGTRW